MKFTSAGQPYDICPICGSMILPLNMGGKKHIESHKYSEANRYFSMGYSIEEVNRHLMMNNIELFRNIPPKLSSITKSKSFYLKGIECQITRFMPNEAVEITEVDSGRCSSHMLWDHVFFDRVSLERNN